MIEIRCLMQEEHEDNPSQLHRLHDDLCKKKTCLWLTGESCLFLQESYLNGCYGNRQNGLATMSCLLAHCLPACSDYTPVN